MPSKVWDKKTYPFSKFNGYTYKFGNWKQFHPTLYYRRNHLYMLGLKLIHVSKRGLWSLGSRVTMKKETSSYIMYTVSNNTMIIMTQLFNECLKMYTSIILTMIKMCCYMIRFTRHPSGSQRSGLSTRHLEVSQQPPDWQQVSPGRWLPEVWLVNVSRNNTILSSSRDLKMQYQIQYLLLVLTSLNVSNWRFRKLVILWMWRDYGMALRRHNGGVWHHTLFATIASKITSWADVANDFTQTRLDCGKWLMWKMLYAGSRANHGPYHWLVLPSQDMHKEMYS